jgi:polyvinyl alcohol dehydrogenase (cytochrome)
MNRTAARLLAAVGVIVVLVGLPLSGARAQISGAQAQISGNWSTYLNSGSRTGYNGAERLITPSTAPKLTKLWTKSTGGSISAEPIQVNGVLYYGSWDGNEYAVVAATGTRLWSAHLGQTTDPTCFGPTTIGVASTATVGTITVSGIPTQAVFVGGGDGSFYTLNARTGRVIWKTQLGTPQDGYFLFSSPVLYNGSIYEGLGSLGDCPLVRGGMVRMNAATGMVQNTLYTSPAGCNGADVWGSPTVDTATGDFYFVTGNAGFCNNPENLAVAVIQTNSSLNLLSSWQVPSASLPNDDSDFGSTPTLFHASISGVVHQMVGVQNKNGIYYALDRSAISRGPVWQQQMADGGECPECGDGDISPSAYDGQHLFVGGAQTQIGGASCAGSIRELEPATGKTVWADCLQSSVLGAVTAVPGVTFFGAGDTAYAVATSTGATLWSYEDTNGGSDFWGAPTISNGHVYLGNQDGSLYAFGVRSFFGLKSPGIKFG